LWKAKPKRATLLRRVVGWCLLAALAVWSLMALALVALRWLNPPLTAVQIERRVGAWLNRSPYRKRYTFTPLGRISPDFQHAVVAAEDARFFQHRGFDWHEIRTAIEERLDDDDARARGASTITQQLVKNLFLTTSRSPIRKGVEFTLVPVAETVLSKRRILELYINVIEWGPGVYGAEAAARYHYGVPAQRIARAQAARLAAVLPSPRKRRPQRMDEYSARILERMGQMGW
jgi:monofunctional biosynthetic peptidoglycan transglycosylase